MNSFYATAATTKQLGSREAASFRNRHAPGSHDPPTASASDPGRGMHDPRPAQQAVYHSRPQAEGARGTKEKRGKRRASPFSLDIALNRSRVARLIAGRRVIGR